jgi:F-type H+-transporting ATPase subunit epsilon
MAEHEQDNQFHFELVAPERRLLTQAAWQVIVPAAEGDIGVRPGHSRVVSSLRPGVLTVQPGDNDNETRRYFVASGFVDISADNCTVLAEDAEDLTELDAGSVQQQINNLADEYEMAGHEQERRRIAWQHYVARARYNAVTGVTHYAV